MKKLFLFLLLGMFLISFGSAFDWGDGSLVAYYDLNTTTKAIDLTGEGHNGTNNGATDKAGILGRAYEFDGAADYVEITNGESDFRFNSNTQDFTISSWIYLDSVGTTKLIWDKRDGAGDGYRFEVENNQLHFQMQSTDRYGDTDLTPLIGGWVHAVVVVDRSGNADIYLNATLDKSASISGITMATTESPTIGSRSFSTPSAYFDGGIDEVGIWNRTLSPSEISELYNSGNGLPYSGGATATITLDSPSNGTTISDVGTNFTVSGNNIGALNANWTNITYYIWNSTGNLVNSTTVDFADSFNFSQTQFIDDFTFQDYTWNAEACYTNVTGDYCTSAINNYTFSVSLFTILSETWTNDTISGTTENFSITIDLLEGYDLLDADLIYNGSTETPSITSQGNNRYLLVSDYPIPIITADENRTFYWNLGFTGGVYLNSTERTQLVRAVLLDNCTTYTNKVFNISLRDEESKNELNGDIELIYTLLNTVNYDTINTLYFSVNNTNQTQVCTGLNLTGENLAYSAEIRYGASGYASELYHIQRAALPSNVDTINLYDLNSSSSTEFKVTYQDSNFNLVEDAIIQLQRKYISEDIYEVVEAPLTSRDGTAILHVDLDSVKYKVTVTKNGDVLDVFDNIVFNCESELTGECEQKLLGEINPQNSVSLEELQDFAYSVSRSNKTITVAFTIPSSEPSSVNIVLTQKDMFGNTTMCNETVISSAGSLSCDFDDTIGDSFIDLQIYKDGEPIAIVSYLIPESTTVNFLSNNYLILIIILLSLVGMALTSPEWMIINAIITLLLAGSLWLINGVNFVMGLGLLMWLVIAAGILILKLAKQEDR